MGYSYNDWEKALYNAGFIIEERKKHKLAIKMVKDKVYRVAISRKGSKEVPKNLHMKMLKQAGITSEEFISYLK